MVERVALVELTYRERLLGTDPHSFHHPLARGFGWVFVQYVQFVVVTDLENIGSNLHAARIALASIVIDHDLRRRFSPRRLPKDCRLKRLP
jgi:hypothetical protein